jgi:hypothetical protein
MNTPFFQFLLYILLVILTYFIVRSISKKVHESFDTKGLPPAINISGKLIKNNLHIYFILPDDVKSATDVKIFVNQETDRSIFYKLNEIEKDNMLYHVVVENLTYNKEAKITTQLKSAWGLGAISNEIKVMPKVKTVEEVITEPPKNAEKYVSCHPDGTYTVHKNYIINPPLINNLSPSLLQKLKNTLKPKEKTYEVEINLQ